MVALQRKLAEAGGVVAEGRYTGTVVFPGAEAKFFLDAAAAVRARRRYLEEGGKDRWISATVRHVRRDSFSVDMAISEIRQQLRGRAKLQL